MSELLTTGKFARLCNTTKDTLYYYRETGLLVPCQSSDNNYFYYTTEDFFAFEMIRILRKCGCSISDIKLYLGRYGPRELISTLTEQQEKLREKIRELNHIDSFISTIIDTTCQALTEPDSTPQITFLEEMHFVTTALPSDYSDNKEAVIQYINMHYEYCTHHDIFNIYPLSTILSGDELMKGCYRETHYASPIHEDFSSERTITLPPGEYAVIYHHGGYDSMQEDFQRLYDFICRKKLSISGNGCTMDLVGNIASHRFDNFVVKICIPVKL